MYVFWPKQFDPVADTETRDYEYAIWERHCPNNSIRLRILKPATINVVEAWLQRPKQFDPVADTETSKVGTVFDSEYQPKQFDPVADTETHKPAGHCAQIARPNNSIRLRILKPRWPNAFGVLLKWPKQFDPVADTETR